MNHQEFKDLIHQQFENSAKTLEGKAGEYATETDRFHTFHVAGRMKNETPEKALWGMALKHLVSVVDMMEAADKTPELFTPEKLTEKIGDLINYELLLKGLLTDRHNKYLQYKAQRSPKPSWMEPENPKDLLPEQEKIHGTQWADRHMQRPSYLCGRPESDPYVGIVRHRAST